MNILRVIVISSLVLLLAACRSDADESPANLATALPDVSLDDYMKVCREFNDGMVYNHEFAEYFSLDEGQAIELDPGLMAVRIYWTELVKYPDEPMMQIQLYLEPDVNLQFPKDEGTNNAIEFLVRSGFRYFMHGPVPFARSNDEFNFRYVIQDGDELVSTYLYRYRTNLTSSGIQAIELGTTFTNNPVIYLYIGEEPPPLSKVGTLQHDLAAGKKHDPLRFLKLRIPSELKPVMQYPYRPCKGPVVNR